MATDVHSAFGEFRSPFRPSAVVDLLPWVLVLDLLEPVVGLTRTLQCILTVWTKYPNPDLGLLELKIAY